MNRLAHIILLHILCFLPLQAQQMYHHCGTEAFVQDRLGEYPELEQLIAAQEAATQQRLSKQPSYFRSQAVYTIPVVVHVVWHRPEENISDEQIRAQIAVLNEDFRQRNANQADLPLEFSQHAADVGLEFCLAEFDPDGDASTGITRTRTDYAGIGDFTIRDDQGSGDSRIFRTDLGGKDAWDVNRYLNIWVAGIRDSSFLGFGVIPGCNTFKPHEDGVIVDPKNFGIHANPPFNLGRTATHEVGHYFNLKHIWGDEEEGCGSDDLVSDTPNQKAPYRGCVEFPRFSCGSSDMFMNFMDYSDDACLAFFTEGQKARMLDALHNFRPGLIESEVCQVAPPGEEGLLLMPNPVDEKLRIHFVGSDAAQLLKLRLFSLAGIELYEADFSPGVIESLDVSRLAAGVYILTVQTGEDTHTAKVLVY